LACDTDRVAEGGCASTPSAASRLSRFRLWWLSHRQNDLARAVTASLLGLTALAGTCFYSLPIYLSQLTNHRGLPLDSVSAGTSVFFVVGSLAGLLVGKWVIGHDPRPLLVVSAIVGGVSVIVIGQATDVWQAYIAYAGMGIAFIACGTGPATVAVLRHANPDARARTLAVSTMGTSIGGVVISPAVSYLIGRLGFGAATIGLGIGLVAVVTTIGVFVMPASPPARPLPAATRAVTPGPSLADESAATPLAGARRDITFGRAVRGRALWLIVATTGLFLTAQVGALAHIVRLCTDRGIGLTGVVVALVTAAAVAARFIGSWVLSRVSVWPWAIAVCAVQTMAIFELAFARNAALLVLGALLLGLALGNTALMTTLLLVETFGLHSFPTIAALQGLATALGAGIGPVLVSVVYERAGGYSIAYLTVAAINAGAVGSGALAARAAHRVRAQRLIAAPELA
jgi:predicted MFS family arabinose efflux permease